MLGTVLIPERVPLSWSLPSDGGRWGIELERQVSRAGAERCESSMNRPGLHAVTGTVLSRKKVAERVITLFT